MSVSMVAKQMSSVGALFLGILESQNGADVETLARSKVSAFWAGLSRSGVSSKSGKDSIPEYEELPCTLSKPLLTNLIALSPQLLPFVRSTVAMDGSTSSSIRGN